MIDNYNIQPQNIQHMRFAFFLLFSLFFCLPTQNLQAQKMNNKKLHKVLTELSDTIAGEKGYWQLAYRELPMLVLTDEKHNRMRIVTPITLVKDLDKAILRKALEANFHTALDVKYAISEDRVWSVFIHPLKELSDNQVKDAVKQVYSAAVTFGITYTSTDLSFPSK